jgi:Ni/Co efflux regulator RcnB
MLAAATFAAPLALPSQAAAQYGDRDYRRDSDRDRDWDRDRDRDRDWDRDRDRDRRDARRHRRHDRGYHRGWNRSRYNGYWYEGRWFYGPPPAYYDNVRFGWRTWRRGDRLPDYYEDYYAPVDYRYYHLRRPPRGYHYVRDDRGDLLLVGFATGIILGVILSNN